MPQPNTRVVILGGPKADKQFSRIEAERTKAERELKRLEREADRASRRTRALLRRLGR